jgi:hypothetical protein
MFLGIAAYLHHPEVKKSVLYYCSFLYPPCLRAPQKNEILINGRLTHECNLFFVLVDLKIDP